ncbi:alpha-galactosidase A precursor [Truncatella angustata]|uniref:Alpha-galactosidase A n=1 Tax=Truncatella angustata TaxID=152316 RepID=A0A9P8UJK6_9PEZI|nr:alpha-galactosidase A precursor [Truncatella angustata]KAH6653366.1 alpha-galactosidase A precursor [Truncatella angustata]KAH8195837.1 hypothetical protein TruAng_010007 [Truncatella angustata]
MTDHASNIRVLQASVDPESTSEFRILIDDKFVKYITIDAGLYECDEMCFGPSLVSILPPLPRGDWKKGRISRDLKTGAACFSYNLIQQMAGITRIWHSTKIDHLDLREEKKLRSNVYEVTCPGFDSKVIAKFARFEWEVPHLEAETTAYSWIDGQQIGPAFLGHLTEEGRVIGFLMTRIANGRYATIDDLLLCHSVLSRLHKLGIKHGDINRHNFLIHGRKATLIDFDNASRLAKKDKLEEELHHLQDQLKDTSGRGGQMTVSSPC